MTRLVWLMLGLMIGISAQTANAATPQQEITATISPAVRAQLQEMSPDARKRIEAAIATGNKYAPHHFDESAYERYDDERERLWQKNIRPWVTLQPKLKDGEWYLPEDVFYSDSAQKLEINGAQIRFYVVCPQPELISATALDDDVELKYRTRIIGAWRSLLKKGGGTLDNFIQDELILDKQEQYDDALITIDKNDKVSRVSAIYFGETSTPAQDIERFEDFIKRPPQRIYQGPVHAEQETEEQARARIPQYKKTIEMIKNVEAAVCHGKSGKTNQ